MGHVMRAIMSLVLLGLAAGRSMSDDGALCQLRRNLDLAETADDVTRIRTEGELAAVVVRDVGIALLDVSEPTAMHWRGSIELASPNDLDFQGGLVVASSFAEGLKLIDVSDPDAPVLIGTVADAALGPVDVEIDGRWLYVWSYGFGIRVYDITVPALPVEVAGLALSEESGRFAVSEDGRTLYAVCWDDGFRVVDVSDPTSPVLIGEAVFERRFREVMVVGSQVIAYFSDQGNGWFIDLSDPAEPLLGERVATSRGVAVAADGSAGVVITAPAILPHGIEIGRFAGPWEYEEIATIASAERVLALAVIGDTALVGSRLGVRSVDIAEPNMGQMLGRWGQVYAPSIAVDGSIAYAGGQWDGLWIVDIADKSAPKPEAVLPYLEIAGVAAGDGRLYAMAHETGSFSSHHGLLIHSLADPIDPVILYSIDLPLVDFVGVFDGVVVGVGGRALFAADVRSDDAGVILSLNGLTPGYTRDAVLTASTVYTACGADGLRIWDITDPAAPVEVGVYAGDVRLVEVAGSTAIAKMSNGELHFLDVTDPSAPVLQSVVTVANAAGFVIDGDLLLVSQLTHLRVFDISDPASVVLLGVVQAVDPTEPLVESFEVKAVTDGCLLMSHLTATIQFLDLSDCPPCVADVTGDGLLDFFDLQLFLNLFANGDLAADLAEDGVLDFFDLQAFLNLYAAGCS